MTDVIEHETPTGIMQVIDRLARDPVANIDALKQLLAMQERITAQGAERAFDDAMNVAQAEMRPIAADANNPQTKSKYASFAALDRALRPIYTANGFSLSYGTADGAPVEYVRVTCRVARAGHKELYHVDMPADGKGAKGGDVMTKTHATGAALTYGQRYLLKLIFNIAVGDDNDGNATRQMSGEEVAANSAINACNTLAELKEWKAKNADAIKEIPSADAVIRLFNDRVRKLKEAAQ